MGGLWGDGGEVMAAVRGSLRGAVYISAQWAVVRETQAAPGELQTPAL